MQTQGWSGNLKDPEIYTVNFVQGVDVYFRSEKNYFEEFELVQSNHTKTQRKNTVYIPTKLYIKVIEARDLLSSDPDNAQIVAKVVLGPQQLETPPQKHTLDPIWKWEHEFVINPCIFNELEVSLWDKETFLGEVHIDLSKKDHLKQLTNVPPSWYPLKPRKWGEHIGGEVLIQLHRTGRCIPEVPPIRPRKETVFDLELSESEAESILIPTDLIKCSKLRAFYNTGLEIYVNLKKQTNDLYNEPVPVFKQKRVKTQKVKRKEAVRAATPVQFFNFPDEIMIRIFSFLYVGDRAVVSRVCLYWYTIMQDVVLRSTVLEILELVVKEKKEINNTLKTALGLEIAEKFKPIMVNIANLRTWEKDSVQSLLPFPVMEKTSTTIFSCLSLIYSLIDITELAWKIDKWKKYFRSFKGFVEAAKLFEMNMNSLNLTATEKQNFSQYKVTSDTLLFIENPTLKTLLSESLKDNNAVAQVILILWALQNQISKQLYISMGEWKTLLLILGCSLIWIFLYNQVDTVKKTVKLKKLLSYLKENEEKIPTWILECLVELLQPKSLRKYLALIKD